uniref:Uncharacterized protein n=1 Tax=Sphingomonas sp. JE1 TaxID=1628059 RepID=A0A0D4ZZQ9_9SPHN|nr:hypothetical protein pJE1_187 [Sphingomonas sp. JE1]
MFLPKRDIKQTCRTFDAAIALNQTFHRLRGQPLELWKIIIRRINPNDANL